MENLIVKPVNVLGDTIIAAKDKDGIIWVGINSFCQGLDMSKNQRDWQVKRVKEDKTLSKGCREFSAGVFDIANEVYALRLDFIPIWLAKIGITDKMEKDHPELAKKLLDYQLKAKDILAEAFIEKKQKTQSAMELLELHYEALKEVDGKVTALSDDLSSVRKDFEDFKQDMPILGIEEDKITNAVKKKGVECLDGKESNAYKNRSLRSRLYADLHGQLRRQFGISSYKAIKRNQTDIAIQIIQSYIPPLYLRELIEQENAQRRFEGIE